MFELVTHELNCTSGHNGTQHSIVTVGLGKAAFVLLGSVNLVLNSLCFLVFLWQKQETTVRLLLLILSFNEVLTSFGMTSVETVRFLLEVAPQRIRYESPAVPRALVRYLTVTWVIANAFLMARNWSVVLIAISRCEAVLRPFSRNTGRCFSQRTLAVTSVGIIIMGLASAVPRAFQEKFHFCQATGRIAFKEPVSPFPFYSEFCVATTFCQAALPVVIVGVASIAMTIGLRRSARLTAHSRNRGGGGGSGGGSGGGGALNSKATRMIQILLAVFVCMEMPVFLTMLIGTRVPEGSQFWDAVVTYAIGFSNLCVNLDSTCNFIIYMATNTMFRSAVLRRRQGQRCISERSFDTRAASVREARSGRSVVMRPRTTGADSAATVQLLTPTTKERVFRTTTI